MSDAERDDKTEEPSLQRLDQLRRDGDVALSKDVVSSLAFIAGTLALVGMTPALSTHMVEMVRSAISASSRFSGAPKVGAIWVARHGTMPTALFFGVIAAIGVTALFATATQTQMGFWPEKLKPDITKMFQISRLKRVVSTEFVTDIFFALLKAALLAAMVMASVGDSWRSFPREINAAVVSAPVHWTALIADVMRGAAVALVAIGLIDFFLQRRRFLHKARMTKEELKREHKDNEGDPQIKQQRKQKHRQMSQGRIEQDVPTADVIVVNPTHIAIALRYRVGDDGAPKVVCKGKDLRADRIREVARENGIPIYRDVPLARMLFKRVKVGRSVPADSYRAVAAVLAFVYRVKNQNPLAERPRGS